MSSPIKYKFWDKEEDVMLGPNLDPERYRISSYNGLGLIDMSREDEDGYDYEMDVEFLQYTGLNDRNGTEIYEGDIVRFLDAYSYGETGDWDECVCTGTIAWDDHLAQFYVTNRESMSNDDFWEQCNEECEVIGNIYEHPHLLKGEEADDR